MATDDRLRRSPPSRKAPKRTLGPTPAGPTPSEPSVRAPPPPPASADDVVSEAVQTAYGVLEDNIELGRQAAERLCSAAPPRAAQAQETKVVASRLMHLTKDLGATWVELCMAMLKDADLKTLLDRAAPRDPAAPATSAVAVTHRVRSRKAAEISLVLDPGWAPSLPPKVAGLHAFDEVASPITAAVFSLTADGGLVLRLDVPEDQVADVYTGVVVDAGTRRAVGTLTVQVLD